MMTGRIFSGRFQWRFPRNSSGPKHSCFGGTTLVTNEGIRVDWSPTSFSDVNGKTVSVAQMKSMMRQEFGEVPVPTVSDIEASPGSTGKSIDPELAQLLQTVADMKKMKESGVQMAAS